MSNRRAGYLRVAVQATLSCLVVAAGYLIYLDAEVRERFEGWRWDLPGELYARPLELYPGKSLALAELRSELTLLNYRFDGNIALPGHGDEKRGRLTLHTRGFAFWDGAEEPRLITIAIRDGRVDRLEDSKGDALPLVRLEPLLYQRIHPTHPEDRVLVALEEVPELLRNALLVVEDREFYSHPGFQVGAIARAFLVNLQAGEVVQGGSTITQQLVKNMFLTSQRIVARKVNELIMAILLELHYDKGEILGAYLNEVYLAQEGSRAIHGFGLASDHFFAKPIGELELHEIALLVAIIKGPSYYSPRRNPERARARRDLVIDLMEQHELIDPEAATEAKRRPLGLRAHPAADHRFPAYVDLVRRELATLYDQRELTTRGLRIFTSLDPILQIRAQRALAEGIAHLGRGQEAHAELQGAIVMTNVSGGEINALVGGREAIRSGFNRALDAVRPIGSLVKPAVYLAAIGRAGYTLTDRISDGPVTVAPGGNQPPWTPRNFDRKSHGDVTLLDALVHSYNLATVRLGLEVGVEQIAETIAQLGVQREQPVVPALLLGAGEMSPMDVSAMYLTIASGGFRKPLRAIREVVSNSGRLERHFAFAVQQVLDPASFYMVDYALRDVMRQGTAAPGPREKRAPVRAGKTGTTDDYRDSWFAGYGDSTLAVVWLGYDDNRPTGLTGRTGALRVWREVMADELLQTRRPPSNVVMVPVDSESGERTSERCRSARLVPFRRGSEPTTRGECTGKEGSIIDDLRRAFGRDE